ncbi:MAG: DUF1207 domain-containing protein [Pirellulales bacterium]
MIRLARLWIAVFFVGVPALAWAQPPAISPAPATTGGPFTNGSGAVDSGPLFTAQNPPAGLVPPRAGGPGGPATSELLTNDGYTPGLAEPRNTYLDFDAYPSDPTALYGREEWTWQVMPSSLIYKSYLAGVKEPRFASQQIHIQNDGWVWDAVLGARVGLVRFGDKDPVRPDGFQIDAEGATQARLDIDDDVDLRSADFRGGLPITFGNGPFRTKFGYYHLSSHLGDEFLIANPNYPRLNYARDCLVLGETVFLTDRLRVYAEVAWAFYDDVGKPWEFQFGLDYSPVAPTGFRGAPFVALNGALRQELNYSGNFVFEAGWAWVGDTDGHLLRIGMMYYNGMSNQFSFYNRFEQQIGVGVWYDY